MLLPPKQTALVCKAVIWDLWPVHVPPNPNTALSLIADLLSDVGSDLLMIKYMQ